MWSCEHCTQQRFLDDFQVFIAELDSKPFWFSWTLFLFTFRNHVIWRKKCRVNGCFRNFGICRTLPHIFWHKMWPFLQLGALFLLQLLSSHRSTGDGTSKVHKHTQCTPQAIGEPFKNIAFSAETARWGGVECEVEDMFLHQEVSLVKPIKRVFC